jgi:adenosylmethionine-8-amino-7-oxononanoate aminotransferase
MDLTVEALEHHWLPFTNNRDFKRTPRMFVRASGMYYWNQAGQKILDGSSGLFTSAAGHCRPEIALAVAQATAGARLRAILHARASRARLHSPTASRSSHRST